MSQEIMDGAIYLYDAHKQDAEMFAVTIGYFVRGFEQTKVAARRFERTQPERHMSIRDRLDHFEARNTHQNSQRNWALATDVAAEALYLLIQNANFAGEYYKAASDVFHEQAIKEAEALGIVVDFAGDVASIVRPISSKA